MKNIFKYTKSISKFAVLAVFCMFFIMVTTNIQANAASSFSISAPSSVEPNTEFTVNFGSNTVGKYTYNVSGGTVTSSSDWIEGSGTLKVKAGESGTVNITITAKNVTTSDYEDIDENTKRSVSVTINQKATATPEPTAKPTEKPSTTTPKPTATPKPSTTTPKPTATPKPSGLSSDANLKSLSISETDFDQQFNSNTTKYTVEVWDLTNININAKANDSKATVSGTGTKTLKEGENSYNVVVTAEDKTKKTYTIVVTSLKTTSIAFDFNGEKLNLVEDITNVESFNNFDKCSVSVGSTETTGWYNGAMDTTLLYLTNGTTPAFYVYNDKVVKAKIVDFKIGDVNYYNLEPSTKEQNKNGYVYVQIEIDGKKLSAWSFESDYFANYKLLELMDENGNLVEYLYNISENKFTEESKLMLVDADEYTKVVTGSDELKGTISQQNGEIDNLKAIIENKEQENNALQSKLNVITIIGIIIALLFILALVLLALKYNNIDIFAKTNNTKNYKK